MDPIIKLVDGVMNPEEVVNYPIDILNSLDLSGVPPRTYCHSKSDFYYYSHPPRFCIGTRLAVKTLLPNGIEAAFQNEKDVLTPRILIIPTDKPFDFKQVQFPISLTF